MVAKRMSSTPNHLRRSLWALQQEGNDFDICDLVQKHLGEDFSTEISSVGSGEGPCECKGSLSDTVSLACSFEDVCEEDLFCATVDVNVTLTGMVNENGGLGKDPQMGVDACVETDVDFLEKMCLELEFAKPNFFVPEDCSFSYGEKKCLCDIDPKKNCYQFDCSSEVPAFLEDSIVADKCKTVHLGRDSNVNMLLPALKGLPE